MPLVQLILNPVVNDTMNLTSIMFYAVVTGLILYAIFENILNKRN